MSRAKLTAPVLQNCPSREMLLSFLQGELEVTDDLDQHLETCVTCQNSLDQLSRESTLSQRGLSPTPWAPNPELLQQLHAAGETEITGARFALTVEPESLPAMAGYRLIGVLGQGGMGVVYDGIHENLGRSVALKTLRADKVNDELRTRLRREAEAIARLNHPNIVQIYEVGEWRSRAGGPPLPYLAMERVFGVPLGQWLAGRPQTPELAAEFTEILARATYAAHQAGIVHRDLKPSNVLVQTGVTATEAGRSTNNLRAAATMTDDGKQEGFAGQVVLKITDFGLAKDVDAGASLTDTGQVLGTPNYMAPEQVRARSEEIGPAADTYALGAMLYEMLTSRPPFVGKTPMEILLQVISVEPVSPRRLVPAIPRDLETICMKCLEKDPRKRYASALNLAEDLQRFRRGEPILARPVGPIARAARWCRRKPAVAGLWAAVVTLLLGAVAVAFWYQHDRSVRTTDELTRQTEARRKRELAEQGMADAMRQARAISDRLTAELRLPGGVALLLNDPARWSASIEAAQASLDHTAALKAGADGAVAEDLLRDFQQLAHQIQRHEADRQLALKLEKVRLDRSTWIDGAFDFALALREYSAAFEQAGLASVVNRTLTLNASLIQQSFIKEQMLASLDDWALSASFHGEKDLATQLLAAARAVDPDPWRDRIRNYELWRDRKALENLADQALANEEAFRNLSPAILHVVGRLLNAAETADRSVPKTPAAANRKAIQWLRHAQMWHPTDFWLNFDLGTFLLQEHPIDAAGYCRTALAVRRHSGAAWTNLGVALRLQMDIPGARHALLKAIDAEPRNARAWTSLGLNLLDQNDAPAALTACKNAVEFEPQYAGAWNNLGMALARNQDRPGAIDAYRKAIAFEPKNARAWNNLGNVLREESDVAGAIKAYETAIDCDPQYVSPWVNLGIALQAKDDSSAAIAAYKKALDLEPRHANAWYNLGNSLRLHKEYAESVEAYHKALKIEPKNVSAWANLGLALHASKDIAGAKNAYQKAIAIDAKHANAWANLGNVFYEQRDWPAAALAYRNATEAEPKHASAWHRLGNALREQKELPAAIDAYKKAIEHDPKRAGAWNSIGNIHRERKDLAAALTAYKAAIGIEPKHANAWSNLGLVYIAQQDYPSAAEALRKTLDLDSTNAINWNNLGVALRHQNLLPAAAEAYQKAIALQPKMSNPHFGLGLVYRDQGRFADAVTFTKKGLALTPLLDSIGLLPQLYECEKLLAQDKRLPLVLKGEKTNPAEQLALAELCYRYKARPADAVRLYAEAFAAKHSIVEDLKNGHRTNAAYAAVRAASEDAAKQIDHRNQALEWLRADLVLGAALVKANSARDLISLVDKLSQWRKHADLASVREPNSLDRLSEAEKKSWLAFWSDVDRLERDVRAQIASNKSR